MGTQISDKQAKILFLSPATFDFFFKTVFDFWSGFKFPRTILI